MQEQEKVPADSKILPAQIGRIDWLKKHWSAPLGKANLGKGKCWIHPWQVCTAVIVVQVTSSLRCVFCTASQCWLHLTYRIWGAIVFGRSLSVCCECIVHFMHSVSSFFSPIYFYAARMSDWVVWIACFAYVLLFIYIVKSYTFLVQKATDKLSRKTTQ